MRFAAGDFGRVMDFVIGVVRKEREIRVAASGGQRAPLLEMNIQWSAPLTMLMKKGRIRS